MRMKLVGTLSLIALALVFGNVAKTYAGEEHSARGWLWGGTSDVMGNLNLGWVSMNNVDVNGAQIVGPISYGVHIPSKTCSGIECQLSGYAWAGDYGWVSFNADDIAGCPLAAATRSGDTLTGGARFLSMTSGSGGWWGCISLSGMASDGTSYGVTIDSVSDKMSGMAWHGEKDLGSGIIEGLGYIDFSYATIVASKSLKICPAGLSMTLGDAPKQLQLFFDARAAGDCSGAGTLIAADVADGWNDGGSSSIELLGLEGGTNVDTVTVRADAAGSATVTAKYNGSVATATVNVIDLVQCECDASYDATQCTSAPSYAATAPSGCNIPRTCSGTKLCSSKWKEVAPK